MRATIKKLVALGTVVCLTVSSSIISFAGEWKQDDIGWWYVNDDGQYTSNAWQEIDGKQFYFGGDGYMLHDTVSPEGYLIGSDGARISYHLSDENVQQIINEFAELYEGAFYIDQAEFEQNVKTFFIDPVEAQYVIDLIRNNHTFVPDTSLLEGGIDTSGWDLGGGTVKVMPLDSDQSLTPEQNEAINNSSWN
ncbi:MAG: hypothetical protein LUK37_03595 [Clostridia bacterium]|nr:hypothetical protein [Clostridia bacterium]